MRMERAVLLPSLALTLAVGCRSAGWDGTVRQWGTLREVLHDGKTDGRVRLSVAASRPHAYGVGAVKGLAGEVLIIDGESWVSEARGANAQTTRRVDGGAWEAALLAVAHVPAWTESRVDRPVSPGEFDDFILRAATDAGIDVRRPFPFLIEGPLDSMELHVINGQCPMAAANGDSQDGNTPFRRSSRDDSGVLVGFYAEDSGGVLTHHDSKTHVHALVDDDQPVMGHVDAVGVGAGAVIKLPARR